MEQNTEYLATTMEGLESVLEQELLAAGAKITKSGKRAVFFEAPKIMLYRLNVSLRTALHILKPFATYTANNAQELYDGAMEIDWPKLFNLEKTFAISSVVFSSKFPHSGFVSLKVKDALADRFVNDKGARPNVDTGDPNIRIFVHIHNDQVTISLDSSGKSLHKRGYRSMDHPAPLNEVLAAGLLSLAGWNGSRPFYDPMCGSGTLITEALMMATGFPPNFDRPDFSFMHWSDFEPDLFDTALKVERGNIKKPEQFLFGSDIHPKSIRTTQLHISKLPFFKMVKLKEGNFYKIEPPVSSGLLVVNPPYGERLSLGHAESFYERLSKRLFLDYPDWDRWVFSSNVSALKLIRIPTADTIHLKNGDLDCRFIHFPPNEKRSIRPDRKPTGFRKSSESTRPRSDKPFGDSKFNKGAGRPPSRPPKKK